MITDITSYTMQTTPIQITIKKPESQQTRMTTTLGFIDLPSLADHPLKYIPRKSKKKGIAAAKAQKAMSRKHGLQGREEEDTQKKQAVIRTGSRVKRTFPCEATPSDDAAQR